jgi:hypothetical protein
VPIVKDLYRENATIGNRDQAEITQWLAENECTLQGKNVPRPIFEFNESTFPRKRPGDIPYLKYMGHFRVNH